jgi:hypothetical protein
MTQLLKLKYTGTGWSWGPEQSKSWAQLKEALCTAPVLAFPDWRLPFVMDADASGKRISAILEQNGRVIAYASRLLTAAEVNYGIPERECLAVVWGLEQYRGYIEGYAVQVKTDQSALRWLMTQEKLTGRLARWAMKLQGFGLEIKYRPGATAQNVDALTRLVRVMAVGLSTDKEQFVKEQQGDPELKSIIDWLTMQKIPQDGRLADRLRHDSGFVLGRDNVLRRVERRQGRLEPIELVIIPTGQRNALIEEAHSSPLGGHQGSVKTLDKLKSAGCWWP